jgi:hypothetical protein
MYFLKAQLKTMLKFASFNFEADDDVPIPINQLELHSREDCERAGSHAKI